MNEVVFVKNMGALILLTQSVDSKMYLNSLRAGKAGAYAKLARIIREGLFLRRHLITLFREQDHIHRLKADCI